MKDANVRSYASVIFFFSFLFFSFPFFFAINGVGDDTGRRRPESDGFPRGGDSRESPRKSVSSTRCRLSSGMRVFPRPARFQHRLLTDYAPRLKGYSRCLPSRSTESAPRWSRNATPPLHPRRGVKKREREREKEEEEKRRKKKEEERRARARKRDSCRTLRNVNREMQPAPGWLVSRSATKLPLSLSTSPVTRGLVFN